MTDLNALAERLERANVRAEWYGDDYGPAATKALKVDLRQAAQALRGMGVMEDALGRALTEMEFHSPVHSAGEIALARSALKDRGGAGG